MAPLDMMDLLKIYFAFKYRPPTNIKKKQCLGLSLKDFHFFMWAYLHNIEGILNMKELP